MFVCLSLPSVWMSVTATSTDTRQQHPPSALAEDNSPSPVHYSDCSKSLPPASPLSRPHSRPFTERSLSSSVPRRRSYDLYDAEADVTRERKTQRFLCSMAAVQVICISPLMVLR